MFVPCTIKISKPSLSWGSAARRREQRPRPKEMRSDKKTSTDATHAWDEETWKTKPTATWTSSRPRFLLHRGQLSAAANPGLADIIKLDLRRTAIWATQGSVWSDFIKLNLPCSPLDRGSHGRCWSSGPTRTRIKSPGAPPPQTHLVGSKGKAAAQCTVPVRGKSGIHCY